ncbi:MAG TPA: hypothetical protein VM286_04810 [Candidatus Thermoplasmatota archaeon]|nr:hypothetical protein [Candidatus Thermoplasmatota archaeon]
MRTAWIPCILVLMLSLAGCGSRTNNPITTSSGTASTTATLDTTSTPDSCKQNSTACNLVLAASPKKLEMNGCQAYYTSLAADADKMKAQLPDGYRPDPVAGNLELAHFSIFLCDTGVVDSLEVLHDIRYATLTAPAKVPADVQSHDPNRGDFYLLELIAANQSMVSLFQKAGFHARLGTVEGAVTGQTLQYHVATQDDVLYDFIGAGETSPPQGNAITGGRWHQSDGTRHAWLNETFYEILTFVGTIGPLTIHGGMVGAVADYGAGSQTTETTIATLKVIMDLP